MILQDIWFLYNCCIGQYKVVFTKLDQQHLQSKNELYSIFIDLIHTSLVPRTYVANQSKYSISDVQASLMFAASTNQGITTNCSTSHLYLQSSPTIYISLLSTAYTFQQNLIMFCMFHMSYSSSVLRS